MRWYKDQGRVREIFKMVDRYRWVYPMVTCTCDLVWLISHKNFKIMWLVTCFLWDVWLLLLTFSHGCMYSCDFFGSWLMRKIKGVFSTRCTLLSSLSSNHKFHSGCHRMCVINYPTGPQFPTENWIFLSSLNFFLIIRIIIIIYPG